MREIKPWDDEQWNLLSECTYLSPSMVLAKDLEIFYPIVTGNSVYLKDLMLHKARWELMVKRALLYTQARDTAPPK